MEGMRLTMKKKTQIRIIVVLFIILMIFLIYTKIKNDHNKEAIAVQQTKELFSSLDQNYTANINKYIIYGTHFNIEGNINIPKISGISIYSVDLILKNINGDEMNLGCTHNYKNSVLSFSTITEINKGLDLESLSQSNYYLILKVIYSNDDIKYYSLKNDSSYENTTYYTITKKSSNNKIDINFDSYNNIPYMGISVTQINKLPDDVYDIVIDPGHGGSDTGAINGSNTESSIALQCAKILKQKLESSGYKVFLTRDGTEPRQELTANSVYDENGRVNTAQASHSKLLISLHLNSTTGTVKQGGVEVFSPSNCNLDFAKLLAKNIVEKANTSYSAVDTYKKSDGVYVRNFTNADILAFKTKAKKDNYEPYNITTSTPYLYMIREIGGIATNAFVDGRNKNYGTNKYYNSNIGLESYLIELGYMVNDTDLQNIINNKDLYMQGIADSINSFYNS